MGLRVGRSGSAWGTEAVLPDLRGTRSTLGQTRSYLLQVKSLVSRSNHRKPGLNLQQFPSYKHKHNHTVYNKLSIFRKNTRHPHSPTHVHAHAHTCTQKPTNTHLLFKFVFDIDNVSLPHLNFVLQDDENCQFVFLFAWFLVWSTCLKEGSKREKLTKVHEQPQRCYLTSYHTSHTFIHASNHIHIHTPKLDPKNNMTSTNVNK